MFGEEFAKNSEPPFPRQPSLPLKLDLASSKPLASDAFTERPTKEPVIDKGTLTNRSGTPPEKSSEHPVHSSKSFVKVSSTPNFRQLDVILFFSF